ncbi:MAG: hypothetical protein QW745_07780 [Thermoplasmata archaeon]
MLEPLGEIRNKKEVSVSVGGYKIWLKNELSMREDLPFRVKEKLLVKKTQIPFNKH